jgi:hypothetical protein
MRCLRDAVGETVQIGIPSGDEGIVIEQVMSTRAVRIGVDLGLRFGLHNNAPGKVLLALRPAKERERTIARIKLERCTDRTITDKQKLREECDRVVEQGYSTDWGEADEGIHCVAAPVRDRSNGLVAAHKNTSFGQARAFSGTSLPSMHPGNRIFSAWRKALLLGLVALSGPDVVRAADYLKEVKPLLQARCYSCHGALKQKAGLRLDTAVAIRKGGEGGSAIKAGNPSASPLLERVVAIDTEERMPPKHEGEPLTPAEVGLLKAWLADGAPAPEDEKPETDPREHWAFKRRVRPPVPDESKNPWVRNPIDAFLARGHAAQGISPQPEASREVLLRRLYLDLIGLPPTPAEIHAAETETGDWYAGVVERLLADPRHGERWARHWVDVWRYSDWWGLGDQLRNSQKHLWHWRDWIVEALNADTPYDEMVRLMLAADEIAPGDLSKLRATGFLARNFYLFNRNQWMEETVEHVGKGFLGLTMNCAKCHDHKYDPLPQADFYRLRAFFEPYHVRLDVAPGEADLVRGGIPRVFDGAADVPTYRFTRGDESKPDKTAPILPGIPALLTFQEFRIDPVALPIEASSPERQPWVLASHVETAKRSVQLARDTVIKVSERRKAASQKIADPKVAAAAQPEGTAVSGDIDLQLAALALARAEAHLLSVERRAEATREEWSSAGAPAPGAPSSKMESAVRAERLADLAAAEYRVAELAGKVASTAADKKAVLENEVKAARETHAKAAVRAAGPVTQEDRFEPLFGAKWTPTRFLSSTKDDSALAFPKQSTGRRKALAGWITDAKNPLTARVAVNHLWVRHMGVPLVANPFDFGRKTPQPEHLELLDWLASEFVESGWSMKHLHKLIVSSAAYRMSSSLAGAEASLEKDPDNLQIWRRIPMRVEAEVVRDSILALAGMLDDTRGGPSVPASSQAESRRRSLYFFHSNNERNLFLTTFDEATVKECYRRDQSIVPQQALALVNSALVLDASSQIVHQLLKSLEAEGTADKTVDDARFVRLAYHVLLGAEATAQEVAACERALAAWRRASIEGASPKAADSRGRLVWVLLNHNDFVTLR